MKLGNFSGCTEHICFDFQRLDLEKQKLIEQKKAGWGRNVFNALMQITQ